MDVALNLSNCHGFKGTRLSPSGNPFSNSKQYGIAAALVGHRCVIVGGYSERLRRGQRVYVYNTKTNRWSSKVPMLHELAFGRAKMIFTLEDKLFAFVWHHDSNCYNFLQLDLVEMEEWRMVHEEKPPLMVFGAAGCLIEQRREALVSVGFSNHTVIHSYNFLRSKWSKPRTGGKRPPYRENHATCSVDMQVFILGGAFQTNFLDVHILDVSVVPYTWSSPLLRPGYRPTARYLFQAVGTRKRIVVYGGYGGQKRFDVYSIPEKRWLQNIRFDTDWLGGTSENAVAFTEQKMWVFGGFQLDARTPLLITPL